MFQKLQNLPNEINDIKYRIENQQNYSQSTPGGTPGGHTSNSGNHFGYNHNQYQGQGYAGDPF